MNDDPVRPKVDAAELRARYDALGTAKVFFGVGVVGTVLGALLPIVQTPTLFFLSAGSDVRFYNLGVAGWLVFLALAALAGAPFIQPVATAGRRAIPLLAGSGVIVGVTLAVLAVSSYGLFGVSAGIYAWLIAAAALVVGYSRRIIIE